MPDRVTLPPFELATFVVNDVVEGSPDALGRGTVAPGSRRARLVGRRIRRSRRSTSRSSVPATRCASRTSWTRSCRTSRPTDPERTFPGALGALAPGGRGRTNRVGGLGVLSVCDWLAAGYTTGDEFPDSFVDMDGPGAPSSRVGDRPRTSWCGASPPRVRRSATWIARCGGHRCGSRATSRPRRSIGSPTPWRRSPHPPWTSIPACRRCAASCRSRRRDR